MHRVVMSPRPHLDRLFEKYKFDFAVNDGIKYWDESARYDFNIDEIEKIEKATTDVWEMCLDLVAEVVKSEKMMDQLKVPVFARDFIADSFKVEPSLYGRMDFSYRTHGIPKLLEFNADTPTSLYEAAVFQWSWLEDNIERGHLNTDADQFNSLHEKLVERFRSIVPADQGIQFVYMPDSMDDQSVILYLADVAQQAGLHTHTLHMADIGLNSSNMFVDDRGYDLTLCFKLYPWEWMFADEFGKNIRALSKTQWIEPAWKSILSNKGMMALLWERNVGHPNLLGTYFENGPTPPTRDGNYVRKPLFSREGSNVEIYGPNGKTFDRAGNYGAEGHIIQTIAPLPNFDDNFPVIGSWIVGDDPAGLTIREDKTPITGNESRFIPHCIV